MLLKKESPILNRFEINNTLYFCFQKNLSLKKSHFFGRQALPCEIDIA
jgi:hypothetical protein